MFATAYPLIVLLLSVLPASVQEPATVKDPAIQVTEPACSLDLRSEPAILELVVLS